MSAQGDVRAVLGEVVRDMDRLSEVGASYTFAPDYVQKVREASAAIAELIAAVQDERILRDLGADVDSKTLASAMRRTSAALRNCRASTLTGAAQ